MVRNDNLWHKISVFVLDDPHASLPFSRRLARDNGWSHAFALRAIGEYRRFVYLACTAGHVVTPSEDVDAVWHLHLTYTKSYWHELCDKTLGQKIHHNPTSGGAQEGEKYHTFYSRTLMSYEQSFGQPPPADIWPDGQSRFAAKRLKLIDTNTHWAVPRWPLAIARKTLWAKVLMIGLLAGSTGAAIAAEKSGGLFGFSKFETLEHRALS